MKITWILLRVALFVLCVGISGLLFWRFYPPSVSLDITTPLSSMETSIHSDYQPYTFDAAPSEALVASLAALKGEVSYVSRTATTAAPLSSISLLQGETLLTAVHSSAEVDVASIAAQLAAESSLSLIQTLPHKIVFSHDDGSITYINRSLDQLQIRIKRLLVLADSASQLSVSNDGNTDIIVLAVSKGTVFLAYNNSNFKTQHATVSAGKTVRFYNAKRILYGR
jgi:hypothetical protein